jgi:hypothetical protein
MERPILTRPYTAPFKIPLMKACQTVVKDMVLVRS